MSASCRLEGTQDILLETRKRPLMVVEASASSRVIFCSGKKARPSFRRRVTRHRNRDRSTSSTAVRAVGDDGLGAMSCARRRRRSGHAPPDLATTHGV